MLPLHSKSYSHDKIDPPYHYDKAPEHPPSSSGSIIGERMVATNPPLSIMRGRQRRVKASTSEGRNRYRKHRKMDASSSTVQATRELQGFVAVLLVVAVFVAVEVVFVDQLFLGAGGKLTNVELHVNSANVFVSDIVEASLNRYRMRHSELKHVITTAEDEILTVEKEVFQKFRKGNKSFDPDESAKKSNLRSLAKKDTAEN